MESTPQFQPQPQPQLQPQSQPQLQPQPQTIQPQTMEPPTGEAVPQFKKRYFGKTKDVHGMLGGGQVADALLWREWRVSALVLGAASISWGLFEWSGYTLLTLLANTALLLVTVIFVWSKLAAIANVKGPPLPENLELSEDTVHRAAERVRYHANRALGVAHSVALGKDLVLFAEVVAGLYVLAYLGSYFNTLSLIFFCVLLVFTLPPLYERYEDQVDEALMKGLDEVHHLWEVARAQLQQLSQKMQNVGQKKKIQ